LWVLKLRLGFGVLDFGLRVKGSNWDFRIQGFGLRVQGSEIRVKVLGFRIWD
jgi:hypothetical protein